MEEYTFLSSDGISCINCCEWAPEGEPKAILQIAHGMAEYMTRYAAFAEFLNKNGILVAGNDHIGHGKSAKPEDWGFFGVENGWLHIVDDIEKYRQLLDEKYPGVPHYLMGHSMGSFVARTYLSKYGENVDGAVIMGTAGTNPAVGAGKKMVSLLRKLKGDRYRSKLITAMAFGSYNKRIPGAKTANDWLTRDEDIVRAYCGDPACGFVFTLAGYADLFNFLGYINSDECYAGIPKNIPFLVVAGGEDPVGEYGKGPKEFADKMTSAGADVKLKLYDGMRHEILNEFGKEEVMEDIKNFILG